MLVRPAGSSDAREIARIHIQTWRTAYAGILPDGFLAGMDLDARIAMWLQIIEGRIAPTQTFVAVDEDGTAGFVSVGAYRPDEGTAAEPGVGEIYAIYVDPDRWANGVGHALMETATGHLMVHGFREIRLWVYEANPRARTFYERCGFALDGEFTTDTIDPDGPYATEATEVRYAMIVTP